MFKLIATTLLLSVTAHLHAESTCCRCRCSSAWHRTPAASFSKSLVVKVTEDLTPPLSQTVYKDAANEWRWRLTARNGRIVAVSSEGYKNRAGCEHGLELVKDWARRSK